MILKPRTVVIISPTDLPAQDTYKASFLAKLGKRFVPEVVCAGAFDTPPEDFRDGLRIAMQSAEESFNGRTDLEYAAHVLPMFMEREPNAPPDMKPFPIVAITVRSWQRTEWIVPYAIESIVPPRVLTEVAACISIVMEERKSPRALDEEENAKVATLITDICRGIDAALEATMPQ